MDCFETYIRARISVTNQQWQLIDELFESLLVEEEQLLLEEGKIYFTHRVYFKGLTAGIFASSFGKRYRTLLPQAMQEIKKIAKSESEYSSNL